ELHPQKLLQRRALNPPPPAVHMLLTRPPLEKRLSADDARRPSGRAIAGRSAGPHVAGHATSGPKVAVLAVVGHHPVTAEPPRERADAVHHPPDPGLGQPVVVAIVVTGNDLADQRF